MTSQAYKLLNILPGLMGLCLFHLSPQLHVFFHLGPWISGKFHLNPRRFLIASLKPQKLHVSLKVSQKWNKSTMELIVAWILLTRESLYFRRLVFSRKVSFMRVPWKFWGLGYLSISTKLLGALEYLFCGIHWQNLSIHSEILLFPLPQNMLPQYSRKNIIIPTEITIIAY